MLNNLEIAKQLRLPEGENSKIITEFMASGNASLYEFTFKQLSLENKMNVLEVGPANGVFVKDLFKINSDIHYTGLDLSLDMVKEAGKLNRDLEGQGKVQFVHGDIGAMHFDNDFFDVIYTVNTLYFWSDVKKAFAEIKRVMKTNGKLYISIRSKETMEQMPFTQFGFQLYSETDVRDLLNGNGFTNVNVHSQNEIVSLPNGDKKNMVSFCLECSL